MRLRDIAASPGITDRSTYGIVTDLPAAEYVVKQKDGRRNGYQIQSRRTTRCQKSSARNLPSAKFWLS
jgi:hypothetical protein